MDKKNKPEIKSGATIRLRVYSGENVKEQVIHMWEEKGVQMIRISSGDLVYNACEYVGRSKEIEKRMTKLIR